MEENGELKINIWRRIKIVWKKVPEPIERNKRAVVKESNYLFFYAKTRKGREINQQKNCKITFEKKLTNDQGVAYNQILDDQRIKEDPKFKRYKRK